MLLFDDEHSKNLLTVRLHKYSIPVTESGCLIWCGWVNKFGYGKISVMDKGRWVHRVAYEIEHGPIPSGLDIDHLCRVRCCVNPNHLEAVTRRTNLLRGDTVTSAHAQQTMCKRGHFLEGENLRIENKPGGLKARQCRECDRLRRRVRYRRKKVVSNGKRGFEIMDVVV